MKKTVKKLLLTLLLAISICNTATNSYIITSTNYATKYNAEICYFDEDENNSGDFDF